MTCRTARPQAILVVSAHWEQRPVTLGATRTVHDKFEYGASICLLCRSYILTDDKKSARALLETYLY